MSIGLSKRWFAWAMHHSAERYDALLADRKRDLLGSLKGTIVEIGPGTGTNFRYYPRGVRWIGVEPNPYMHPHLRRAGNAAGIEVHVRQNHAEDMGLADGSAQPTGSKQIGKRCATTKDLLAQRGGLGLRPAPDQSPRRQTSQAVYFRVANQLTGIHAMPLPAPCG
jgi:Methyltransferase domain